MSKEFGKLPNGVFLGRDFFSKKTVEETGQEWAGKRRLEFASKNADIYAIRKDKNYFLGLPRLDHDGNGLNLSPWVPRVDSFGNVYTTRWESDIAGDLSDYMAFGGKRYSSGIGLPGLPKSRSVAFLVPQKHQSIESALRQQDELRHDYDIHGGVETDKVESVIATVFEMAEKIKSDGFDENDLNALAKRTETMLKTNGLLSTTDRVWGKIVNLVDKASKKDSLNRLNPLVSRVRARAAYVNVVEKEVLGRLINSKSENVFNYLSVVRLTSRMKIQDALGQFWQLLEMGRSMGIYDLVEEYGEKMDSRVALRMSDLLHTVVDGLAEIKVSPYLDGAVFADAVIMGSYNKTNMETARIKNILFEKGLPNEVDKPSCEEYLRRGKTRQFFERLRHANSFLECLLDDKDNSVYTVFSSQTGAE